MKQKPIYLLLHNIRSVYNVGAMFRTADAAGVTKIFLTGYTPAVTDRFGSKRKDIAKVALGAEESVPSEYFLRPTDVLKKLKKERVKIIGIEQDKKSVDYKKVKITSPTLFVVGSEVGGLTPALKKYCDVVAEIPMQGKKDSLNVSVALGVALFRMLNR